MTEQERQALATKLQAERDELKPHFDQVCSKTDWKAPIDTTCRREHKENVARAIEFFTATNVSFSEMRPPSDEWVRVQSRGYRAGPAGDH
jgi:hypothetical protein